MAYLPDIRIYICTSFLKRWVKFPVNRRSTQVFCTTKDIKRNPHKKTEECCWLRGSRCLVVYSAILCTCFFLLPSYLIFSFFFSRIRNFTAAMIGYFFFSFSLTVAAPQWATGTSSLSHSENGLLPAKGRRSTSTRFFGVSVYCVWYSGCVCVGSKAELNHQSNGGSWWQE